MGGQLEVILRTYPHPYLTDAELAILLKGTPDSRYGKVKRLLAQGKLQHIRRGLYCITDRASSLSRPHPYELAQYIYGPSYISLEAALSFHQLIPERVYTITSVTGRRQKRFQTPLGVFDYLHVPSDNFFTEVDIISEGQHSFFMAKPWKAICDYLFCYKKDWKDCEPLSDSLRINCEELPFLREEESQLLDEYYDSARISRFLKGVQGSQR